jgi:hypothetical protein
MAAADREPTSDLCRAARPARPQGGLSSPPRAGAVFLGHSVMRNRPLNAPSLRSAFSQCDVEKAGKPINPAFSVDADCAAATGISLATTPNNTALGKRPPTEAALHKRQNQPHRDQGFHAGNGDAEIQATHDVRRLGLGLFAGQCGSPCILSALKTSRMGRGFVPIQDSDFIAIYFGGCSSLLSQPFTCSIFGGIGPVTVKARERALSLAAGRQLRAGIIATESACRATRPAVRTAPLNVVSAETISVVAGRGTKAIPVCGRRFPPVSPCE